MQAGCLAWLGNDTAPRLTDEAEQGVISAEQPTTVFCVAGPPIALPLLSVKQRWHHVDASICTSSSFIHCSFVETAVSCGFLGLCRIPPSIDTLSGFLVEKCVRTGSDRSIRRRMGAHRTRLHRAMWRRA